MKTLEQPQLRMLEIFPVGQQDEQLFAVRDPEGIAEMGVLPLGAAILVSLMNGQRTLAEIQSEFQKQVGQQVALADIESLVAQLDERHYLDSERFREYWQQQVEAYLAQEVRPAAHAGGAYEDDPDLLRAQLEGLFTSEAGPGAPDVSRTNGAAPRRLCGVLSPHIDLHRGGPAFAHAYKKVVEESDADLFVIFGTAHGIMRNRFCVSRKHFQTPLGTAESCGELVDRLVKEYESLVGPEQAGRLFADEMAHRHEHSIEFQVVFLQYLLAGRREFKIVPILTGSFHEHVAEGNHPGDDEEFDAFVQALRKAVAEHPGRVCFISGGDLAHIGRRFGDADLLDKARLQAQESDDRALLEAACQADSFAFFNHVAAAGDRNRICGLSPTYTMLQVMQPSRGELLRYDQAVEEDGTSCVSFASLAFYHDE